MALDRYEFYWAENLETDPVTNRPNRESPPPEVKMSGLKYHQPEAYEWYNYQHWKLSQGLFQIEDEYTQVNNDLQQQITQEVSDRENGDIALQNQLDAIEQAIISKIYPVGAYYITESNQSPATILGLGNWLEVTGQFLVGFDSGEPIFSSVGNTGGTINHNHSITSTTTTNTTVADHTLTVDEMPSHSHELYGNGESSPDVEPLNGNTVGGDESASPAYTNTGLGGNELVKSIGGGQGHNHTATSTSSTSSSASQENALPPYRVVHIWRRVS